MIDIVKQRYPGPRLCVCTSWLMRNYETQIRRRSKFAYLNCYNQFHLCHKLYAFDRSRGGAKLAGEVEIESDSAAGGGLRGYHR